MTARQAVVVAICSAATLGVGYALHKLWRPKGREKPCVEVDDDQVLVDAFLKHSVESSTRGGEREMDFEGFLRALDMLRVCIADDVARMLFRSFSDVAPDNSSSFVLTAVAPAPVASPAAVEPARLLSQEQFISASLQIPFAHRKKEKWVHSLKIHRLIAKQLPDLEAVFSIEKRKLRGVCREIGHDLEEMLWREVSKSVEQASHATVHPGGVTSNANSKFDMSCGVIEARYGKLDDFFEGLDGRIGLPNPNVLKAMELEHCAVRKSAFSLRCRVPNRSLVTAGHALLRRVCILFTQAQDSSDEFETLNYGGTVTAPKTEWEFVVCPEPSKMYPGKLRAPVGLDSFVNHETAIKAKLITAEVCSNDSMWPLRLLWRRQWNLVLHISLDPHVHDIERQGAVKGRAEGRGLRGHIALV